MKRTFRIAMMLAAYALTIASVAFFQQRAVFGQTFKPGTVTTLAGKVACDCSNSQNQCGCIFS
jgi:hypothetical protein